VILQGRLIVFFSKSPVFYQTMSTSQAAIQDLSVNNVMNKKVWKGLTVGVLIAFVVNLSSLYSAVVFLNVMNCLGLPSVIENDYVGVSVGCILVSLLSSFAHYKAVSLDSVRWSY